jgi:nucleotide-binding universal stress UspA family protein
MTSHGRTIVVGVGSLHESDPVLAPAVALARRTGAKLRAVHAYMLPEPMIDAYARMGYLDAGIIDRYGEEFQARLETLVREAAEGLEVECRAVAGTASQVLHEEAESSGAELIVVGSTHRGTLSRIFLGTTAEATVRGSPVPVLVLRERGEPVLDRVLLTTDLSEMSSIVHQRGIEIATRMNGGVAPEIRSLLVVAFDNVVPPPLRKDLLDEAARSELDRFLSDRPGGAGSLSSTVRFGDPPREILDEAADWRAQLVVVGTHGRRGLARLLLGSVAGSVLRGAPCHVLVIPPSVPAGVEGADDGTDEAAGVATW